MLDNQGVGSSRKLSRLFRIQVIKGMRTDYHWQIIQVEVFRREPCVRQKRS